MLQCQYVIREERLMSDTLSKRILLAMKQNWICHWCSQTMVEETLPVMYQNSATVEHLTPKCFGGTNHESNLVSACYRCNQTRGHEAQEIFIEIAKNFLIDTRSVCDVFNPIQIERTCIDRYIDGSLVEQESTSKMRYRVDMKAARAAFADGIPNPFEPDSRRWRLYERTKARGCPGEVKSDWGYFDPQEFKFNELEFWILLIMGAKLKHLESQMKSSTNST